MARRLRSEGGWALATAMIVLGLMTAIGLATLALADMQTRQSGRERVRESAFNLAEGALTAQIFVLSQSWPGSSTAQYPTSCSATTTGPLCPDAANVSGSFSQHDYASGTNWTTMVRDNNSPNLNFYDDTLTRQQPSWDANGDRRVWVRAQALVHGKWRTLVALVRVETQAESFPRNAITAGRFTIVPSGKQTYISTLGSAVAVRCFNYGYPAPSDQRDTCAGYKPSNGQVSPDTVSYGYTGGNAISDDALTRFKKRAQANGTYCGPEGSFNSTFCDPSTRCPRPGVLNQPDGVVYVVPLTTATICNYGANIKPCCASAGHGELLILESGKLDIAANISFYGLIYNANKQASSAQDLVKLEGGMTLYGAAVVDGDGGVTAGSNGLNLVYDPNVFNNLISFGSAGIIRNTWREIPSPPASLTTPP